MNRSTLTAMVVALMLGSGVAGYLIGQPRDSVDHRPVPPVQTATVTPPAPAPSPTPPPPPTTPVVQPTPPATALPAPAPEEGFVYRRVSIDSTRADGEACFYFNKLLAAPDAVTYGDYLRVTPDVKSAIRVVDDRLCISGLAYGHDYSARLLAGLPAKDGTKLAFERTVDVALGARPAVVSLPGKGFILPRGVAVGLPISTINVGKVGIAVYRVTERALERFTERYSSGFPGTEPLNDSYELRSWLNGTTARCSGAARWR